MKEKIKKLEKLHYEGVYTKPFIEEIVTLGEILTEIDNLLAAPLEHSFIVAGETFKEIAEFMSDFATRNNGESNPIVEDAVIKTTFLQVVIGLNEHLNDALPILVPTQNLAFILEGVLSGNPSYEYFVKMYEHYLRNRSDLYTISKTLVVNSELVEKFGGFEEKIEEYTKNLQGFKPE